MQRLDVVGLSIGQNPLGVGPNPFVRIEFGSIAGEVLYVQAFVTLLEPTQPLSSVNGGIVEQHDDIAAQMSEQLGQKLANLALADVVLVEAIVESEPLALGADRDR